MKDADALLIEMFVRGYSVGSHQIHEALIKEFRKAAGQLNATIRSIFADRNGLLSSGRKRQLRGQMGQLDSRLISAGLVVSDDVLIAILRAARDPRGGASHADALANTDPIAALACCVVGGLLALREKTDPTIPRIIRVGADQYEAARRLLELLRKQLPEFLHPYDDGSLAKALHHSLHMRGWTAFGLVLALRVVESVSDGAKVAA
jgi:hypothetical protein